MANCWRMWQPHTVYKWWRFAWSLRSLNRFCAWNCVWKRHRWGALCFGISWYIARESNLPSSGRGLTCVAYFQKPEFVEVLLWRLLVVTRAPFLHACCRSHDPNESINSGNCCRQSNMHPCWDEVCDLHSNIIFCVKWSGGNFSGA